MKTAYYKSPIGIIEITEEKEKITSLYYVESKKKSKEEPSEILAIALNQLDEYFKGKRKDFDFPMLTKGTEFQKKVWKILQKINYAALVSYSDIARKIGNPKAVRAVGGAIGKNPISVFIPCHRVIGSNGTLTGFGGGLWRKEWLIEHEQKNKKKL